jgi:hypothetical protein
MERAQKRVCIFEVLDTKKSRSLGEASKSHIPCVTFAINAGRSAIWAADDFCCCARYPDAREIAHVAFPMATSFELTLTAEAQMMTVMKNCASSSDNLA